MHGVGQQRQFTAGERICVEITIGQRLDRGRPQEVRIWARGTALGPLREDGLVPIQIDREPLARLVPAFLVQPAFPFTGPLFGPRLEVARA